MSSAWQGFKERSTFTAALLEPRNGNSAYFRTENTGNIRIT